MKTRTERVYELILETPITTSEIANKLGENSGRISPILNNLRIQGVVEKIGQRGSGRNCSAIWKTTGVIPACRKSREVPALLPQPEVRSWRSQVRRVGDNLWEFRGQTFTSLVAAHRRAYAFAHGIRP